MLSVGRWAIIIMFFCYGTILVAKDDTRPEESSEAVGGDFFKQYETLSDEEIAQKLAEEGVDAQELKNLMASELGQRRSPSVSGAGAKVGANRQSKLAELIAKQKEAVGTTDELLQNFLVFHTTPQGSSIPEPAEPIIEVGTKVISFLNNHVKGKKPEVAAMIAFVMYRQFTWLGQKYIEERTADIGRKLTPIENILGMTFFDSRLLTYIDFMVRGSFCAVRLYLDISKVLEDMKKMQFLQDPDVFLSNAWVNISRAYTMFSRHDYYHVKVSLLERVLLQLALPFVWTGLLTRKESPDVALHHPIMQRALSGTVKTLTDELIYDKLLRQYLFKLSPEKRDKIFNSSFGLVSERLFSQLSLWVAQYANRRFVLHKKQYKLGPHMARKVGKYTVRHVYLHYLVMLVRAIVRRGGLQFAGSLVHKLGWVLGFFKINPIDGVLNKLKHELIENDIINPGEDIKEILIYPAAACPGAFAKAVRSVITKQKIGPILAKEPRFVAALNAMHKLSVYDLMQRLTTNLMTLQEMSARVVLIKNAVDPQDWNKILNQFLNEAVAEIFLDRKHVICREFTERILTKVTSPLLHGLYSAVLPEKQYV